MSRFRPIDRETDYLLPASVQDWLPESHLARYVVDVVEGLENAPRALNRLFDGSNHGKLIVKVTEEE